MPKLQAVSACAALALVQGYVLRWDAVYVAATRWGPNDCEYWNDIRQTWEVGCQAIVESDWTKLPVVTCQQLRDKTGAPGLSQMEEPQCIELDLNFASQLARVQPGSGFIVALAAVALAAIALVAIFVSLANARQSRAFDRVDLLGEKRNG